MTIIRKGLSIGTSRINDQVVIELGVVGKLSHDDYQLIVPMVEAALAEVKEPKIKVLRDAREFEGWELRAAWGDFKLGLKHRNEFSKIAIVGNKPWEKYATKVAGWFTSGEAQYFEDMPAAVSWLCE